MYKLSKSNYFVKEIIKKGYRVIDNKLYNPKGKRLSLHMHKNYYMHNFSLNKEKCTLGIHKIVAFQKFGDKMFKKNIVIRHLNSNSFDNSINNIEIGTQSQNVMDMDEVIRKEKAKKAASYIRKYSDEFIKKIKKYYEKVKSYKKVMVKFNIKSKGTLHYILNNEYVMIK